MPQGEHSQGLGLQQQQQSLFSPQGSCREQVPAWLPSNPPGKELGAETLWWELPSLLACTL